MQPKSSATVVVVLSGTWPVRSISAATSVMAASVVSNGISEMPATAVVFPTPNPPAMTILTGSGGRRAAVAGLADGLESTDHSFHDGDVANAVGVRSSGGEMTARDQVADEHPGDPEVQAEPG